MLLQVGWIFLLVELSFAVISGLTLWHVWSHSAVPRTTVLRALGVYAGGCMLLLLLSLFLPL